jgi:Kyakuja-Dileera-Zisupton transposase
MKYPLAVVNRLLELYGEDVGLGYNIMCAFMKTLAKSS